MKYELHHGDCREVTATMADNSVDAIVTDPPYGLSFMGKGWDHGVPGKEFWAEALRVAKPGAHLLAFGGTRTFHRLACAIEDAGWEIRDTVGWIYGSGFPKSADVSKHLDAREKKQWLDVCKALDNAAQSAILAAWKEYSRSASNAGLSFAKSETETGTNTLRSDFVPEPVLLRANPENADAIALVAELSSIEAHRTTGGNLPSVQSNADDDSTASSDRVIIAGSQRASREVTLSMVDSSALQSVWGWQGEDTADKLKAVEALKTWLGSKPSSRRADTAALCVALTEDLKHIMCSRSETFQNFDMTRQTACVSAINVIITESTAENLISFTADTLKSKAIDKAAGAEREVVGSKRLTGNACVPAKDKGGTYGVGVGVVPPQDVPITAPATDAARQWAGWGTALKPAWEPVIVARKPLVSSCINVLGMVESQLREQGVTGDILWKPESAKDAAKSKKATNLDSIKRSELSVTYAKAVAENETQKTGLQTPRSSGTLGINGIKQIQEGNESFREKPTETCENKSLQPTVKSVSAAEKLSTTSLPLTTSTEEEHITANKSTEKSTPNCGAKDFHMDTESFAGIVTGLTGSMAAVHISRDSDGMFLWPTGLPKNIPGKPLTVAHNVLTHGTGAINVDGGRVETDDVRHSGGQSFGAGHIPRKETPVTYTGGRWPANVIHDGSDEATAPFGSAARFFYCAKASKRDRDEGCEGLPLRKEGTWGGKEDDMSDGKKKIHPSRNHHPTVKPTDLMRYLCRLVTPPDGVVLDPFMGSGSTGKAALLEGFRFIGIEREAEYLEIARARIEAVVLPLIV